MKLLNRFKSIQLVLPVLFIVIATVLIILFGRGYRFDIRKNDLRSTGLLVANSDPNGAQVFVDGILKTATNATIGINPDWYTVTISKEGYIAWQKKLRVQGEVVTNADAFLFPSSPSLSPLTTTGVKTPTVSPQGTRLAYVIPENGIFLLTMSDSPLGFNRQPQKLADTTFVPLEKSQLLWSPDGTQLIILSVSRALLIEVDKQTTPREVTNLLPLIEKEWNLQKETESIKQISLIPEKIRGIATQSAQLIAFSPDEHKFLYEATQSATIPNIITSPLIGTNPTTEVRTILPDNVYVYDIKEDRNYFVASTKELGVISSQPSDKNISNFPLLTSHFSLLNSLPIQWFPTSRHLILALPGKIDIMEYDRTNWATVYSGPHESGFVIPWPGSSRLVVLTNLNTNASTLPNLYTVNLR